MNVIYEVELHVDAEIAVGYRAWLPGHVAAMLALPGFVSADVLEVVDPGPADGGLVLSVRYRLASQAVLDDYLELRAPRMREEGLALFGDRFRAFRRVLWPAGEAG